METNVNMEEYSTIRMRATGAPIYLTVSASSVLFNKGCLAALGQPDYAKILIANNKDTLLVIPSDQDDSDSIFFSKEGKTYFRINSHYFAKSLLKYVNVNCGRDVDSKVTLKIPGKIPSNIEGLLFEFKNAEELKK